MTRSLPDDALERGLSNRRSVLGDAWVDRSVDNANAFNADFQNLITRYAWHEIWGRPGLDRQTRRLLVLAITASLSRWEEFELHCRAAIEHDIPLDAIREALMQTAIYAGVPAANTAFATTMHILRDKGLLPGPAHPADSHHPGVGRPAYTASAPALYHVVREPRLPAHDAPAPTVVLSHALGCDHAMWDALADRLSATCRVVAYDQRGHGRSGAPEGPYSMADLADDAARLIDELGCGPVIWVGLSMGGMVGQELALRHPDRVRALVIANSTSGYPEAARAMWRARIDTVRAGGIEAIADAVMQRYFHDAFRAARPAVIARFRRQLVATDVAGYLGCCEAVAGVDTTERLDAVRVPTLVIAGAHDAGAPPEMSRTIAERIPGARLVVLPDASHLAVTESPREFADEVERFVESVAPAA